MAYGEPDATSAPRSAVRSSWHAPTYFASGNGGQEVVVVPDLDMVIAAYGGSYADKGGFAMIRDYIPTYILPALRDETR